jgi:hypothetical protein
MPTFATIPSPLLIKKNYFTPIDYVHSKSRQYVNVIVNLVIIIFPFTLARAQSKVIGLPNRVGAAHMTLPYWCI